MAFRSRVPGRFALSVASALLLFQESSLLADFAYGIEAAIIRHVMDTAKAAQDPAKNRRKMLEEFVAKHPADAFGRYGLAMECIKENDTAAAEDNFKQLLSTKPEYVAAYFQYGRMLAALGRAEQARRVLAEGVARASKAGDAHALSEMQAALDDLG